MTTTHPLKITFGEMRASGVGDVGPGKLRQAPGSALLVGGGVHSITG